MNEFDEWYNSKDLVEHLRDAPMIKLESLRFLATKAANEIEELRRDNLRLNRTIDATVDGPGWS